MINYDYENCPWYSKINDPPATIPVMKATSTHIQ